MFSLASEIELCASLRCRGALQYSLQCNIEDFSHKSQYLVALFSILFRSILSIPSDSYAMDILEGFLDISLGIDLFIIRDDGNKGGIFED
ncbi:IQ domain-containing protein [Dirofilaria immitis]